MTALSAVRCVTGGITSAKIPARAASGTTDEQNNQKQFCSFGLLSMNACDLPHEERDFSYRSVNKN